MERDDIIIREAVLHILDSSVGMPVLSDSLLESGPDLNDFLRAHICRLLSGDDLKRCEFDTEHSEVYAILREFKEENLIPVSKELAGRLYTILNANLEIPAGDVFFVTFQTESRLHLAILKMNYKEVYVHYTSLGEQEENINEVMRQTAALPLAGGKLAEAVLIDLSDDTVLLAEKKFPVNGEKVNYLSELFLHCHAKMSQKTKLDLVTKAVEQIHKKYYEDDFEQKMKAKSVLHEECTKNDGAIRVEEITEKVFREAPPEVKEEFVEKLEKYRLPKEEIKLQSEKTTKKFEKQYLTTDSGIEINIPMEEYHNKQHVEFITNQDGTVSVLIKNVNRITSK